MKKIFSLLFILIIPLVVSAQWYGDGLSESTAYYGVINSSYPLPSNQQFNTTNYTGGVVYVGRSGTGQNDLEVGTGGTLTVGQGITVKFCTTTSDLRITGSGILNASGNSSSRVVFTKNSTASWGHITFEGSTGISVLDFCEISYGSKTGTGLEGYGGGIQINSSNLTISNSLIHDNTALWGGGIFVNHNVSPIIDNCHFYSNTGVTSGGGIYLWSGCSPVIQRCIIENNNCTNTSTTYGGGGIGSWTASGLAKVINCTIVNNVHQTSGSKLGDNIHLNGSNYIRFINCIVWGSDNSVFIDVAFRSTNFVNSGVQRVYNASGEVLMSSYTNSFKLNSLNEGTNPSGPYFNATNGTDWSIKFSSPCRDAGTIPSPTVPNDYIGNPRIGPYDIGAYEVQYSRWKTTASSTDWSTASNWEANIDPSQGTGDVIIPAGLTTYPVSSSNPGFTIASGKQMILNPGAKVTLASLTNNGILRLESDANGISSLITNSFSGNDATVELFLTGGGVKGSYKWHYISIPFTTSVPVSIFTGVTFDIARYNEPRVSSDVSQGWIGYDGWVYGADPAYKDLAYAFSNLTTGTGYEFWDNADNKFTISGQLNTADVSPTVTFKSGGIPAINGFNLIGNPFPSGLDWNYIIANNFPLNTSKSLYFTLNNKLASYIGGVGVPAGVNGFIPPMQGFMTKTYVENHTIVLAAAARTHSMHARYKGASVIPLVRLSLAEDSLTDETVVRFDELAKSTLDNDFDAVKMSVSPENLLIYSSVSGSNYVINGQPFPDTFVEIPIVVNLKISGNHTITSTELQGLDNYNVYLIDNTTGFTANLRTTPVLTFSASAGKISDRFILKVSNVLTGTEDPAASKNIFNIYNGNGLINIQTIADEWDGKSGSVNVLDLAGKTVSKLTNTEFNKGSVIQVQAPAATGLYVVELRSGTKRFVGKVVVR